MRKVRNLLIPVALVAGGVVLAGGTAGASGTTKNAGAAASSKVEAAATKRGPRGLRGKQGKRGKQGIPGPLGPQGPQGPPGPPADAGASPTVPLVFKAPANTPNTVLLERNDLRVEASCLPDAGGTTRLTGRSLKNNGVIRATAVATGTASTDNDFDENETADLLPGGATESYALTYLSAANGVLTANYSNVNKSGGSSLGDCVIYGTFTLG
jgi:hypothetical protein